jgi:hypothetical protein
VPSVGSGTHLTIEVTSPVTVHSVTVAQIRRWCDGVAVGPDEVLKRKKICDLLSV